MTHLTLREAREQRRPPLTQVQLAQAASVDQTYISLIERGLRTPSDDIKQRLAKALGIAPSRLRFADAQPDRNIDQPFDRRGHVSDRRVPFDRRGMTAKRARQTPVVP